MAVRGKGTSRRTEERVGAVEQLQLGSVARPITKQRIVKGAAISVAGAAALSAVAWERHGAATGGAVLLVASTWLTAVAAGAYWFRAGRGRRSARWRRVTHTLVIGLCVGMSGWCLMTALQPDPASSALKDAIEEGIVAAISTATLEPWLIRRVRRKTGQLAAGRQDPPGADPV